MNKVVGTSLTYWLWSIIITTHNLLFSSFSYKQPFQKKNELGTSSAAMFSHYTAIKIKHKCYQFFFLQVTQMEPVSSSLKLLLISHLNSVQNFFSFKLCLINNKDLIILTFITIAG